MDECGTLAEEALKEHDLFSAVKFHLLSSEPENALRIGISHVKGSTSDSLRETSDGKYVQMFNDVT